MQGPNSSRCGSHVGIEASETGWLASTEKHVFSQLLWLQTSIFPPPFWMRPSWVPWLTFFSFSVCSKENNSTQVPANDTCPCLWGVEVFWLAGPWPEEAPPRLKTVSLSGASAGRGLMGAQVPCHWLFQEARNLRSHVTLLFKTKQLILMKKNNLSEQTGGRGI